MKKTLLLSGFVVLLGAGLSIATPDLRRPFAKKGTIVVPERFVRTWDPVTIFFTDAIGKAGEPEDDPSRFVEISPPHPGAYQWLDEKTLQFKPAEPWPALTAYRINVGKRSFSLSTLMSAPRSTTPADRREHLEPVDSITLEFGEPLSAEALKRMVRIELRPLPGLDPERARWVAGEHFEVKVMERNSRSDTAVYVLRLREPIPENTRAIVHLQLSLDERSEESFYQFGFTTMDAFRVVSFGCSGQRFPSTVSGSVYPEEQAARCGGSRQLEVMFSSEPSAIDPVVARNLVRLDPPVDDLSFSTSGRMLYVRGPFQWEQRYDFSLHPTNLEDARGRSLEMKSHSRMSFSFPKKPKFLRLSKGNGFIERYGPQMVPIEGRGYTQADLRVFPVEALDKRFWPFERRPFTMDERRRPPGPGEERKVRQDYIWGLGSPPLSRIVDLASRGHTGAGRFGLDLQKHLEFLSGKRAPGTYLVGLRELSGGTRRHWMRVQVTDLNLAVTEEVNRVRFLVTSLRTAEPLSGAEVVVEATNRRGEWVEAYRGSTDAQGFYTVNPSVVNHTIQRVYVKRGVDMLVINPSDPPPRFRSERWRQDGGRWLNWITNYHSRPTVTSQTLCHVFSERPLYRPEEKVYLKGYLRQRTGGEIQLSGSGKVRLRIQGPGQLKWEEVLSVNKAGSFSHVFDVPDPPAGNYRAHVDVKGSQRCSISFNKEAYRIPKFEVRLAGESEVALDRPFAVKLAASYYAGGPVSARPVRWRVTQFPYSWWPSKPKKGFIYATDRRYSGQGRFEATANVDQAAVTDDKGGTMLELNPAIEPSAQARTYVVEATVTGADDQTVTATRRFNALPPFVIGMKVARFLERAKYIEPLIELVDFKGKAVAKQPVTVRLIHRTWHSHLQASDFASGVAKYITDIVDEKVLERNVTSTKGAFKVRLPISEAGVYIVEVEARDRLGRAQVLSADLFAGGDRPVNWKKPKDHRLQVSTNKKSYAPGETAKLVVQSPFQNARMLVVTENPQKNSYRWIDVKGGVGLHQHQVTGNEVPRVPIHIVLMRGRVAGSRPTPGNTTDLGKPTVLATTKWIQVEPVEHQVKVELEHPKSALPGKTVAMKVKLSDNRGRPKSGEVTLWLIDQAVLSLGREQPLDPLPAFITAPNTRLAYADNRNRVMGRFVFAENPGGDGGEERASESDELLDRTTVRKNFQTVPFYDSGILVPRSGEVTVQIALPDNLTNFMVRAKAVSDADRFGFAKSKIAVRLPVIVQPALPRFVRAGDNFQGGGIARVVEGKGGPGQTQAKVENGRLVRGAKQKIKLLENRAVRIAVPIQVASPRFEGGAPNPRLKFKMAVERKSDRAADAFEVSLPLLPDRDDTVTRKIASIAPGKTKKISAIPEATRPGTLMREFVVSDEPAIVKMAAGLDFQMAYPYDQIEAKVSRGRSLIALAKFRKILAKSAGEARINEMIQAAVDDVGRNLDSRSLVKHWPGSRRGNVSLTAWSLDFLTEAKRAGYQVDGQVYSKMIATLERALRSDYQWFVDGASYSERTFALAALARANRFSGSYAAELARKSNYLSLEAGASVVTAFDIGGKGDSSSARKLAAALSDGISLRLHQGKEIYHGLTWRYGNLSASIIPSETRTIATLTQALGRVRADDKKLPILRRQLVTLGRDDGWGSTNANAAALIALAEYLEGNSSKADDAELLLTIGGKAHRVILGSGKRVATFRSTSPGAITLRNVRGGRSLVVQVESRYVAQQPGSQVGAASKGFVVERTAYRISSDRPAEKLSTGDGGQTIALSVADIVEEQIKVVNPKVRHYVAVAVPLAAGLEPMNPRLATSPAEAKPSKSNTIRPTFISMEDDRIVYYFESLQKGTFDFYFRAQALTPGRFTQPPAKAEMLYDFSVSGRSNGARIEVKP